MAKTSEQVFEADLIECTPEGKGDLILVSAMYGFTHIVLNKLDVNCAEVEPGEFFRFTQACIKRCEKLRKKGFHPQKGEADGTDNHD